MNITRTWTGSKPRRAFGHSYLELVAAIAIISGLVAVAINKLSGLTVDAERTAVESTVGALRSAIGIEVADLISARNIAAIRLLEGGNPMEHLAEQPSNYIGVRAGIDPMTIPPGKWYFDSSTKTLVYRVINDASFIGGPGTPARIRFEVRLVYVDKNGNRKFDQDLDVLQGVRLAAVEPYHWTSGAMDTR